MVAEKDKGVIQLAAKGRILMVVMDGLGDRAVPEFSYRTPLQKARTPNMDWFTENGSSGIIDIIAPGVRPGSDTAHLALLGYDPYEVYAGRGPFEAAGIGLIGRRGDVAFRCNFASVDEDMVVTDRRAGRVREPDTQALIESLQGIELDGVEAIVGLGTEHRAALILRGEGLSSDVSDVDPHDHVRIWDCKARSQDGEKTANAVNEFVAKAHGILDSHPVNDARRKAGLPPANILLPRGAGSFPDIVPFPEKNSMPSACVAGVGMIKGICGVCGLDVLDLPGCCTGGTGTDMMKKAEVALKALESHDFVLMNIKAPDLSGHDSLAEQKVEVIERMDAMFGMLRTALPEDVVIALTADHSTPVSVGDHSGDPVPLTIYSRTIVRDDVSAFNEADCGRGRLGRLRGKDLLPILMDLANRSEKFGA